MKPMDIEKQSFAIIEKELTTDIPPEYKPVVKRVIHTTADFSYETSMMFSDGVIEKALMAIREGTEIVTDTNMAKSGINHKMAEKYSVQIVVLGEVRAYMIFSYDPLCENRPHLLFLPSSCEIHSPYVTRALQRIGGGNEICRLRFHGKPVFLKGKDGTVVTVVWRISTSPVRDIASTVQNIQNRNM